MPWNQPGSGGDKGSQGSKDPWGQRNNQQGPPDLDKVIKDIKDKIGLSLGGRKGGSGGGSDNKDGSSSGVSFGMIALLGVVAAGLWLASGFYTVNQGSQGIELHLGKYKRSTEAGLHWHLPSPIETVDVINVTRENTVEVGFRSRGETSHSTVPQEALMLTKDENIIDIHFAVQYDIKSPTDLCLMWPILWRPWCVKQRKAQCVKLLVKTPWISRLLKAVP